MLFEHYRPPATEEFHPPVVFVSEIPLSHENLLSPIRQEPQGNYDAGWPPPHRRRPDDPPLAFNHEPQPELQIERGFPLRILQTTYQEIMQVLEEREPEFAGMLLGPKHDATLVTHVVWDDEGTASPAMFQLNGKFLNKKIRLFRLVEMECKGFVHSHPLYVTRPSQGDIRYVLGLFGNPKNAGGQFVYMPIFCGDRLYPYAIDRRARVAPAELTLI